MIFRYLFDKYCGADWLVFIAVIRNNLLLQTAVGEVLLYGQMKVHNSFIAIVQFFYE